MTAAMWGARFANPFLGRAIAGEDEEQEEEKDGVGRVR